MQHGIRMSGNCLEELDSQPEVLAGKQFSVANIVALDAVDRRQMKIFRQDVARTHEKTLGIHEQRPFRGRGIPFLAWGRNPGHRPPGRNAHIDLIGQLPLNPHILDLRNRPKRFFDLREVDGKNVDAFPQAGRGQRFLAAENSVQIEGDSMHGVFAIPKEESIERHSKPEKSGQAKGGNENQIGYPAHDRLPTPAPAGGHAHANVQQLGPRKTIAQSTVNFTAWRLAGHSVRGNVEGKGRQCVHIGRETRVRPPRRPWGEGWFQSCQEWC